MSQNNGSKLSGPLNTEINLRYLAFYVLKKWRIVFLITLIFIIVGLCFTAISSVRDLTAENYVYKPLLAYNNAVDYYNDRIRILEFDIADKEDGLALQQGYNQESILMQINPDQKKTTTLTYYIDTGDLVLPEFVDQDVLDYLDYADSLLQTYLLYLNSGELFSQFLEAFPEMNDIKYIREIYSTSKDSAAGMITITIISNDDDMALSMLDIVRAGMAEVYQTAQQTIGKHKLTEISLSSYLSKDSALADRQQSNYLQILTINNQLREKNDELETLTIEASELAYVSHLMAILIQLIKTGIFYAFGGLLASILLLSMYYYITDVILDTDKIQCGNEMLMLGRVPRGSHKRLRRLDRLAAAFGGITRKAEQRDSILALTAQSICKTVMTKGITEGKIALAGSISIQILQETADAFNQAIPDSKLSFTAAGYPMWDVNAVEGIAESAITVIVEMQDVSRCADVRKEAARIITWGKPILGIVLLNTDSI